MGRLFKKYVGTYAQVALFWTFSPGTISSKSFCSGTTYITTCKMIGMENKSGPLLLRENDTSFLAVELEELIVRKKWNWEILRVLSHEATFLLQCLIFAQRK